MDYSKAHAVTLWCAVLAKAHRGLSHGVLKGALPPPSNSHSTHLARLFAIILDGPLEGAGGQTG